MYHLNTNTRSFLASTNLLKFAQEKESVPPFKNVEMSDNCTDGKRPISLYFWPGSFKGCICTTSKAETDAQKVTWSNYKFLHECHSTKSSCYETNDVNSVSAINFFKYVNGKEFCYEPYPPGEIIHSKTCTEPGVKKCSFGVCVQKDGLCPVTDVEI